MPEFTAESIPQAYVTKKLFQKGAFIPDFQRSAAWGRRQMMLFFDAIQEFLGQDGNQTIDSGDKVGHKLFLGGMSLQREPGGDRLGIHDGQQRMNAIVAFSAAARDVLFEQEDFESAMAIQKDIVGTNELLFQSSSDLIELFKQLHRPMVMLGSIQPMHKTRTVA